MINRHGWSTITTHQNIAAFTGIHINQRKPKPSMRHSWWANGQAFEDGDAFTFGGMALQRHEVEVRRLKSDAKRKWRTLSAAFWSRLKPRAMIGEFDMHESKWLQTYYNAPTAKDCLNAVRRVVECPVEFVPTDVFGVLLQPRPKTSFGRIRDQDFPARTGMQLLESSLGAARCAFYLTLDAFEYVKEK